MSSDLSVCSETIEFRLVHSREGCTLCVADFIVSMDALVSGRAIHARILVAVGCRASESVLRAVGSMVVRGGEGGA